MPKIIPIKDLKDTAKISLMVRENMDPVYITKNGYDDMVIMSSEEYGRLMTELEIMEKLLEGERAIARGETVDAIEDIKSIRRRYGL